jgi:hypothetical protein
VHFQATVRTLRLFRCRWFDEDTHIHPDTITTAKVHSEHGSFHWNVGTELAFLSKSDHDEQRQAVDLFPHSGGNFRWPPLAKSVTTLAAGGGQPPPAIPAQSEPPERTAAASLIGKSFRYFNGRSTHGIHEQVPDATATRDAEEPQLAVAHFALQECQHGLGVCAGQPFGFNLGITPCPGSER